jgi:hypothetical protein
LPFENSSVMTRTNLLSKQFLLLLKIGDLHNLGWYDNNILVSHWLEWSYQRHFGQSRLKTWSVTVVKKGVANLFYQLDIVDPVKELRARTVEIYGIFYGVHCGH